MQVLKIVDGVVVNLEVWEKCPESNDEVTYLEVADEHPAQIGYLFDGTEFTWHVAEEDADPGRALVISLDGEVIKATAPAPEFETE